MSSHPPVLVLCINWNGESVLSKTLESLLNSDYPHYQVVVVDNASTDNSLQQIRSRRLPVEILELANNRGYGGGINAGLEHKSDDPDWEYVLLLNNDLILKSSTLPRLVACAQTRDPGICAPLVLQADDPQRVEASAGRLTFSHVLAEYQDQGADRTSFGVDPVPAELLLGSILLVHRSVWEIIGGFDEDFFMYHEEVDFLFRAKSHHFPVHLCPRAEVLHAGGHSTRQTPLKKVFWTRRNTLLFFKKHKLGPTKWIYYWATLAASLLYNLGTLRWRRMRVIIEGVVAGLQFSRNDRRF